MIVMYIYLMTNFHTAIIYQLFSQSPTCGKYAKLTMPGSIERERIVHKRNAHRYWPSNWWYSYSIRPTSFNVLFTSHSQSVVSGRVGTMVLSADDERTNGLTNHRNRGVVNSNGFDDDWFRTKTAPTTWPTDVIWATLIRWVGGSNDGYKSWVWHYI